MCGTTTSSSTSSNSSLALWGHTDVPHHGVPAGHPQYRGAATRGGCGWATRQQTQQQQSRLSRRVPASRRRRPTTTGTLPNSSYTWAGAQPNTGYQFRKFLGCAAQLPQRSHSSSAIAVVSSTSTSCSGSSSAVAAAQPCGNVSSSAAIAAAQQQRMGPSSMRECFAGRRLWRHGGLAAWATAALDPPFADRRRW